MRVRENGHYSEFLTGRNRTPYGSSELLKAPPSPAEQVIVGHFSSGPLNTLLAFWIANKTKKIKRVIWRDRKKCV